MLSDDSKERVERLIRVSSGIFNDNSPADFYVYYHPTLYLFESYEVWATEENAIKRRNLDANRILSSRVYAIKKHFNLENSPVLLPSLASFDKKTALTSGTFKIGVTNSSARLTKEERAYLNEFRKAAKNLGFRRHKTQFSRDRDHTMHGWTKMKTLKLNLGRDALELEQKVLLWVREDLKLNPHLTKSHLPQSGWTETIDAAQVDLSTLWAKIKELSKVYK